GPSLRSEFVTLLKSLKLDAENKDSYRPKMACKSIKSQTLRMTLLNQNLLSQNRWIKIGRAKSQEQNR
ncbi:MAG: hypothetical protein WA532_15035, partial [Candidatus Korobacteraceae bacterium]